MKEALFYLVILLANIIQGITGFAGTILAMPFSIMLVGYDVAKPILNVLGILSGIYVFVGNRKYINKKELTKIVLVMAVGILGGIFAKQYIPGDKGLFIILGGLVIFLAIEGGVKLLFAARRVDSEKKAPSKWSNILLVLAGLVHGIFVCGGPILIGYLSKRIEDKKEFRATISTVWIFLNTLILVSDIASGTWNLGLVRQQLISIPFLFGGMFIGGKLYKIMSQKAFLILTYVLLFISGITLLIK